jgi:hypothetical protein
VSPCVLISYILNSETYLVSPLTPYLINTIEVPKENKIDHIKEICWYLPQICHNTFVYLIKFFLKIIEHADVNKVSPIYHKTILYLL